MSRVLGILGVVAGLVWVILVPFMVHILGGMWVVGGARVQAVAASAASKYDAAGLATDSVVVAESPYCGGSDGQFVNLWPTDVILLCDASEGTLTHELAHNWVYDNTSPDVRGTFMEYFGIDTWNDKQYVWSQRGTEAAAEVVVWVVDPGTYVGDVPSRIRKDGGFNDGWIILTQDQYLYPTLDVRLTIQAGENQRLTERASTGGVGYYAAGRRTHGYPAGSGEVDDSVVRYGHVAYLAGDKSVDAADHGNIVFADGWLAQQNRSGAGSVERADCSGNLWRETIRQPDRDNPYPRIVCELTEHGTRVEGALVGLSEGTLNAVLAQIDTMLTRSGGVQLGRKVG